MADRHDILGNYEKKAKAEKERERELKLMMAKYREVFDTPIGREVFKDIMEFCMTFKTTMTGNSWTYFNEGKRAVGLHLLNMREQGWENEIDLRRREHIKEFNQEEK